MEKTRHAGIGIKVPTANARTSDRLASVMDGPTSTSALLIRSSKGNSIGCRLTACTSIHILSTPTCYDHRLRNFTSYNRNQEQKNQEKTNIWKVKETEIVLNRYK